MKESLKNAKKIGLTLKNIKTFEGHDMGLGFNADVCINGKIVFHVFDSAYGGCYDYSAAAKSQLKNNEIWKLTQELEDKLKLFPKYTIKLGNREFKTKDTLECIIGALISEYDYKKQLKKDQKKGIVFESENGHSFISWKAGTIPTLIKKFGNDKAINLIQNQVRIMQLEKKNILNKDYLKSIGIKFDK